MRNLLIVLIGFVLYSCDPGKEEAVITKKQLKEPLIQENIKITKEESRLIDRFVERRGWEMVTTGTGLRYMIYENGAGLKAEKGKRAVVEYEITLLNGQLCYKSEDGQEKTFLIGRDNIEQGIHEGVTYMKEGDRAKFVVPAYLAHGLTGDGNRIPPRASLVVDLYLKRLE